MGIVLDVLGAVIAWAWSLAPVEMTLIGLSVACSVIAMLLHPRDRRHMQTVRIIRRRVPWAAGHDPAEQHLVVVEDQHTAEVEPLAPVVPLRRAA
jgi:hypothetical protein